MNIKIEFGGNIAESKEKYRIRFCYKAKNEESFRYVITPIKSNIKKLQNNDKLVIHVVDSSWEPISGCLEQYGCNCENVIILDLYDLNKRDEYLDEIAKIELRNPDGKKIEVGENNEYTGFYYRGQSNEAWDFNSGLYRFLTKERNAEKIKVDWDVRKFNKLTEKLNEIFSQIEVGKKNKLPRHDLQHLAAKTGYIDLSQVHICV